MQDTGVSGKGDKRTNHHLGRIPAALALHHVVSQLVDFHLQASHWKQARRE